MDRDVILLIVAIVSALAATVALGLLIHRVARRLAARRFSSAERRNQCFWCGTIHRQEPADHEMAKEWLQCRSCGQKVHDHCHHQIRAMQADWVCPYPEAVLTCPACGRRSINDESCASMAKLAKELAKYAKKADARPPGAET